MLYCKHLLVRTPLEGCARWLRHACDFPQRLRQPELRDVWAEEGRIRAAMGRLLRRDSNCMDVGAHLGSMLSDMMRFAPEGRHVAFEPVPRKAAWLRKKFPEVAVHQLALADVSSEVTFYEDTAQSGLSGLGRRPDGRATRAIQVRCERADQLIPPDHRIDLMKIDVEGAELLVLRGAGELIGRHHPVVIFESAPGAAEKVGTSRRQLFEHLTAALGYDVWFVQDFLGDGAPLDWGRFDEAHHYPFKALNYIAGPGGSKPRDPKRSVSVHIAAGAKATHRGHVAQRDR